MPLSDNVEHGTINNSIFEDLVVGDTLANFDAFEAFNTGTKDKAGGVTVSPDKIINDEGDPGETDPKKKNDEPEKQESQEHKLDSFLDKHQGVKPVSGDDDEEDDTTDKSPTSDNEEEVNPNQAYYQLMVKSGFWDEVEGFDGSDEAMEKMILSQREKDRQEEVDTFITEAFEKNPDGKVLGKALLSHLANGGAIADFVAIYQNDEIKAEDLDNDDSTVAENAALRMLSAYHSMNGMEPEEINSLIKRKKEKGLLIDTAKDIVGPYTKKVAQLKADSEQSLALQKANAQRNAANKQKALSTLISQNDKIRDVTIGKTKAEKDAFINYMLRPTVQLENGSSIPQLYADLSEIKKDPEWDIVLAATVQAFKDKKAPSKTGAPVKTSIKDTIKEVLQNNTTKAIHQSASSENKETGRPAKASQAWAGIF